MEVNLYSRVCRIVTILSMINWSSSSSKQTTSFSQRIRLLLLRRCPPLYVTWFVSKNNDLWKLETFMDHWKLIFFTYNAVSLKEDYILGFKFQYMSTCEDILKSNGNELIIMYGVVAKQSRISLWILKEENENQNVMNAQMPPYQHSLFS